MRVDAHQHFWRFDPERDNWITDDMAAIKKDFFPEDLKPLLDQNGFDGCIAVQASQSEAETDFLISLARKHNFIKGVVGWVDLRAANIAERLAQYQPFKIVKGFRHVLQGEPQRDLMLQPEFKRGIAALRQHGFTYNILIFPDQLKFSIELVALFPEQKFVVDHLAKPYIKRKEINEWKAEMEKMAVHQNVYCKISGMVTEADWKAWKKEDFHPYMDAVVNAFGIDRILFGSDWPVCQVAATFNEVVEIVADYFTSFSTEERAKFFGRNAAQFYNL